MSFSLTELLSTWQRTDLLHRLGESGVRMVCWAAAVGAVLPQSLWAVGGLTGLLAETGWTLKHWRSRESVADAVDAAGDTHGLLRTALAAEQDAAWGSPDLIALVKAQAADTAPGLSTHAIRRFRLPRAPLVVGLIALLLFFRPGGPAEALPSREVTLTTAGDTTQPTPEAAAVDGSIGVGISDGEGEQSGGLAKAQAERGEGEAGATGSAGGGSAQGEARQGAEGAGESEAGSRPGDRSSEAEGGSTDAAAEQTEGGMGGEEATTDSDNGEDPDAEALVESAERDGRPNASNDPYGNEQETVQQLDQERMEKHYTDLDNAVGAGTMAPQETSMLSQDFEETATNTFGLALAGQGGINDAPGTVDLAATPDADSIETVEERIAARWRSSAAGTIQTIDGGQSGGQSGQAWEALYADYAELAEARMHADEIPPGRRDYVRAYFESIRSEQ